METAFDYELTTVTGQSLPAVTKTTKPREGAVWDFDYPSELHTTVERPAAKPGSPRLLVEYEYELFAGSYLVNRQSDSCPGCGGSQIRQTTFVDGLAVSQTDARGTEALISQLPGEREVVRIEARGSDSRPANPRSDERKITTEWHPYWRVPTSRQIWYCLAPLEDFSQPCTNANSPRWRLESKTTYVLNDRGQVTATCVVDTGDAAAVQYVCGSSDNAPSRVRQTLMTYCEADNVTAGTCPFVGLLTSQNGPRTDVTDITTWTYRADNGVGPLTFRKGDLWKVTSALGHVTEYLNHDRAGRVTSIKDANGVITNLAYHARGWLESRTLLGVNPDGTPNPALDVVTRIEYEPHGDIKRVFQPDDTGMEYCRDSAHRVTAVVPTTFGLPTRCNAGVPVQGAEAIVYVLDSYGNRVREEVRDSASTIRRLLARQYNTLNQLSALVNAEHADETAPTVKTSYDYDANGNLDTITDPLGRVTDNDYDPLNRLIQSIQDADTPTAIDEIEATVDYEYDARDNLRKVTDPKRLDTDYGYDALGVQISLDSPDTGLATYLYDAAGNRTRQTDARGVRADYTYDALNRLRTVVYESEPASNVTYTYDAEWAGCAVDEKSPIGRLTLIEDASGQTRLCYDRFGNTRRKVQVTGATTLTVQYRYNKANRLIGMTYPSGLEVSYSRDTQQGRVIGVALSRGTFSLPLVSGVDYLPFGPIGEIRFGSNNQVLNKVWDQNYWPDAVNSPALDYDFETDDVGNITQVVSAQEGDQSLEYDRLSRLTLVRDGNTPIESFAYDKTGNRSEHTVGTAAVVEYEYPEENHRLFQIGDKYPRSYDENGNTLSGHLSSPFNDFVYRAEYNAANRFVATYEVHPGGDSASMGWKYNGRGERVTAQVANINGLQYPPPPDYFLYNESGQLLVKMNPAVTPLPSVAVKAAGTPIRFEEVVWIDDVPVGRVESISNHEPVVHVIHTDHLNTPRALANAQTQGGQAAGTVVWRWNLNQNTSTGSNVFGQQPANENPDQNRYYVRFDLRFPGQQYEPATGLHYNYFRDYEPGTGRYVESDPIGLDGGISTYAYVSARPLTAVDPSGLLGSDGTAYRDPCCQTSEFECWRKCMQQWLLLGVAAPTAARGTAGGVEQHFIRRGATAQASSAAGIGRGFGGVAGAAAFGFAFGCSVACTSNNCAYD